MKKFRDNGAIGALLDEYEKAVLELINTTKGISSDELVKIVDPHTQDPDCRSIQTILSHVVNSGYGYAIYVRTLHLRETIERPSRALHLTIAAYHHELRKMFEYNEQLFIDYPKLSLEEYDNSKKMLVPWGQSYDIEQLFEHAIVHVLRHRRQIERFLLKLRP